MLVAKSRWKRAAHQASSTQSRRRRRIITGRCPQAAPDAPRATRAAAARSSTHRCTSPHPALQRRDSCRRRSNSARRTRRPPSPRLLTAPPPPPATKQTQRNRHRRNQAGGRLQNGREARQGRLLPGLQSGTKRRPRRPLRLQAHRHQQDAKSRAGRCGQRDPHSVVDQAPVHRRFL